MIRTLFYGPCVHADGLWCVFLSGRKQRNKGYLATNQHLVIRGTYFYPGLSRVIHFNLIF